MEVVSSRSACVAGVNSVPSARIGAQRRRSCTSEVIAPAAQAQDGFQSVESTIRPEAVWFV